MRNCRELRVKKTVLRSKGRSGLGDLVLALQGSGVGALSLGCRFLGPKP